jgi:hypothetical protein
MHSDTTHPACDCGAILPSTGTPANEYGMALAAGEAPAFLLVNCNAVCHTTPRTFALAVRAA